MEDGEGGRAGGACIQIVKGFVYLLHSSGDGGGTYCGVQRGLSKVSSLTLWNGSCHTRKSWCLPSQLALEDFSGGPVAKNPPANMGSIPGLGRLHMPQGNHAPQLENSASLPQVEKARAQQQRPSRANK